MASVKCSKCGYGIHYHGEPNGIEYIFILNADWKAITSSCLTPKNKGLDTNKEYPKLFQSDTIEEDFPGAVHKYWKCPKCGSLFFFDDEGNVTKMFAPTEQDNSGPMSDDFETGVIYDDYSWDALTEASVKDNAIPEKYPPSASMQLSDNLCAIVDQYGNKAFFRKP